MTAREAVCLNESVPQLQVPQAADTYLFPRDCTFTTAVLTSSVADGASAVGFTFNTANALATSGAKICSWKTSNIEKMYLRGDGVLNIGSTSTLALVNIDAATLGGHALQAKAGGTSKWAGLFYDNDGNQGVLIGGDTTVFRIDTQTGGVESFNVVATGRVGILENSPDYLLDVNGTFGFTPGTSVTPVDNGDVVIEFTNNTTITIKGKGSDGTVRSGTVTLA